MRQGLCTCLSRLNVSIRVAEEDTWQGIRFDLGECVRALLAVSPCLETLNLHICFGISEASLSLTSINNLRLTFGRLGEEPSSAAISVPRSTQLLS